MLNLFNYIFSALFILYATTVLGLSPGRLGVLLGLRPTLWIATVGAVSGALFVLFSPIPRMRDLPDQPD